MNPEQALSMGKLVVELLPKPFSPKSYFSARCFPVACCPFPPLSMGEKEGE